MFYDRLSWWRLILARPCCSHVVGKAGLSLVSATVQFLFCCLPVCSQQARLGHRSRPGHVCVTSLAFSASNCNQRGELNADILKAVGSYSVTVPYQNFCLTSFNAWFFIFILIHFTWMCTSRKMLHYNCVDAFDSVHSHRSNFALVIQFLCSPMHLYSLQGTLDWRLYTLLRWQMNAA